MYHDKRKYTTLEPLLQRINRNFVTINDEERRRVTPVLQYVIEDMIEKLKEVCPLFKHLFESVFYGGSYYDGLKVGKPEEFDIDLKLVLPTLLDAKIEVSSQPGFVRVKLPGWSRLEQHPLELKKYSDLKNMTDSSNYLLQNKILFWMEGIVNKAILRYPTRGNIKTHQHRSNPQNWRTRPFFQPSTSRVHRMQRKSRTAFCILQNGQKAKICLRKSGPAMTLNISSPEDNVNIDVDLVASFKFTECDWPRPPFEPKPAACRKTDFLVVPKSPKGSSKENPECLWRLSFQEQERELMSGHERFKPVLRLMKKFRDTQNQVGISSYFLKTIFLNETFRQYENNFWQLPLSFLFMHMLQIYQECLSRNNIPYYWNKNNNLLSGMNKKTVENYGNWVKGIITNITNNCDSNPNILEKYLLSSGEAY